MSKTPAQVVRTAVLAARYFEGNRPRWRYEKTVPTKFRANAFIVPIYDPGGLRERHFRYGLSWGDIHFYFEATAPRQQCDYISTRRFNRKAGW